MGARHVNKAREVRLIESGAVHNNKGRDKMMGVGRGEAPNNKGKEEVMR